MEQNSEKQIKEKVQDKAVDVIGNVAEEGAKQILGLGSALSWAIKIGSVIALLVVVGVIALIVFLVARFF